MEVETPAAPATQSQDLKFVTQTASPHSDQKVVQVTGAKTTKVSETAGVTTVVPPPTVTVTRQSVITQPTSVATVTPSQPTSTKDSLSREAIDFIESEFVKLKSEQIDNQQAEGVQPATAVLAGTAPGSGQVVLTSIPGLGVTSLPATTVTTAATEGGQLVYCNLNDLDLAPASAEAGSEAGYYNLASLAEASQSVQNQDKTAYPGVSTLVLQGGVLQLKGDGSGLIPGGGEESSEVFMTVTGPPGADKMVPIPQSQQVQVVSLNQNGQARVHASQDAIASILASMNTQNIEAENTVHQVEELEQTVYEDTKSEPLPLNLATTATEQVVLPGQPLPLQGIKRINPQQNLLSTKKVIIATINGTQRILTPVSTPQFITMKSNSPRVLVDTSGNIINGGSPILLKQSTTGQPVTKQKPVTSVASPNAGPRNPDNKTCMWKFENGQICGKVFTKTYNLTVHMRMHQDIRPFPCGVCEQTFRQKAHLQRHEATHGIDSTANRKKRKRPGSEEFTVVDPVTAGLGTSIDPLRRSEAGVSTDMDDPNGLVIKRKTIKIESEGVVDFEPIQRPPVKKCVSNVNVGTNTDLPMPEDTLGDEIEDSSLEPARLRNNQPVSKGVEQGVQYCEEDLIVPESLPKRDGETEMREEVEEEMYSSQQYVTTIAGQELVEGHFQTTDGQFIDTSANQIVMSSDGELVGFVPVEAEQQQSPVVNISTTTNEQGQQVVIIENLHHHSEELRKEIINALMAENNLIQLHN